MRSSARPFACAAFLFAACSEREFDTLVAQDAGLAVAAGDAGSGANSDAGVRDAGRFACALGDVHLVLLGIEGDRFGERLSAAGPATLMARDPLRFLFDEGREISLGITNGPAVDWQLGRRFYLHIEQTQPNTTQTTVVLRELGPGALLAAFWSGNADRVPVLSPELELAHERDDCHPPINDSCGPIFSQTMIVRGSRVPAGGSADFGDYTVVNGYSFARDNTPECAARAQASEQFAGWVLRNRP